MDVTSNKDLFDYLKKEINEGKIDFGIRAEETETGIDFYIHPLSADGETINFSLIDQGETVQLAVTNKTEWNTEPTEIFVNTRKHSIKTGQDKVSYEEIVRLAGEPKGVSVTYRSEPSRRYKLEGILSPGQSVALESGMRFDAYNTSNA